MTTHTPGPWWTDGKWDEDRGCTIIAARTDSGPLPGNPTRGMVAFATQLLPEFAEECEANARLIAAAPDLLKALIECAEFLENKSEVQDGDDGAPEANAAMSLLREVEEVLARARATP